MFFSYLKRHIKIVLLLCLFIGFFSLVFYLYDIPLEAALYGGLLCLCIGALFFGFGFASYLRRHKELSGLVNRVTISLEELPVPKGALEADYQLLLQILSADRARIASRADEMRGDMVDYYTLWAHQIKTPIAAMSLLLSAEENRQNRQLSAELFKIEQYVDMVLQYLRLDSDTSDFVLEKYDLDEILRQAIKKYARLFILQKLSLQFEEGGLTVLTDEKWLVFVIGQILSNSLKYTKEGSVHIYTEGGDLVIADTGMGIQPEDLPRVFEKGFTGYNGRWDKKSTGIGLYLCKSILDKLGHTIRIESQPGKGTTVRIGLTKL